MSFDQELSESDDEPSTEAIRENAIEMLDDIEDKFKHLGIDPYSVDWMDHATIIGGHIATWLYIGEMIVPFPFIWDYTYFATISIRCGLSFKLEWENMFAEWKWAKSEEWKRERLAWRIANTNARVNYPNLIGLPSFTKMAALALLSYLEITNPAEEEMLTITDIIWKMTQRGHEPLLSVSHPLRIALKPYLLRYYHQLQKELDDLPEEKEDHIDYVSGQLELLSSLAELACSGHYERWTSYCKL